MGGAIILTALNGCIRWVAIFTSTHLGIDNLENKYWWWPQLLKELTDGDGYKYRFKPNAVPSIFPHKQSKQYQISKEIRAEKLI